MDAFRVISPGSFTTVQDRGRYSFIDRGVPPSGVLDPYAYRIANLLVGNPADAAVLEITVMGPALEVLGEADVALTGADMAVTVNRQRRPDVANGAGEERRHHPHPPGEKRLPGLPCRHGRH